MKQNNKLYSTVGDESSAEMKCRSTQSIAFIVYHNCFAKQQPFEKLTKFLLKTMNTFTQITSKIRHALNLPNNKNALVRNKQRRN